MKPEVPRKINLSPEAERFVREQVQEATYPDESAVIEAAISMWRLAHASTPDIPGGVPWTKETLRAAIKVGIDQLDRGEVVESDAEDIMRRVHEQLQRERTALNQKVG
ncbi:MAG: hypothetical protein WBD40_05715 [Tepidisphaeraceae bacterium]